MLFIFLLAQLFCSNRVCRRPGWQAQIANHQTHALHRLQSDLTFGSRVLRQVQLGIAFFGQLNPISYAIEHVDESFRSSKIGYRQAKN